MTTRYESIVCRGPPTGNGQLQARSRTITLSGGQGNEPDEVNFVGMTPDQELELGHLNRLFETTRPEMLNPQTEVAWGFRWCLETESNRRHMDFQTYC